MFYSSAGSMYEAPDIIGYRSVGNLKMGEDCKVEYLGKYCSLEGTDADGHRVYTYKKPAYDEMTFRKSDIASVY